MHHLTRLALAAGVLLSVTVTASAQVATVAPGAKAAAPASAFESTFNHYQPAAESDKSPDQVWRDANQEVGKAGGGMGHMAHMAAMPGMEMKDMKGMEMGGQPVSATPAADPHQGHDMSHMSHLQRHGE
ncbi:hypothetical protein [Janthinobacterium agaricidamnosum]|uniref:Copper resistance B domain protein n=1 Tax=Janthinobacterium agaricidamnosum NBRC 102515 = DSM 9628 TaxID=1349767 RepID=W0V6Q3_9BURK|nr:hypothetical protein [Janthinobacterium agaricidamnosum]CDG83561.1 hypothetical protein GJA_2935 [Janthinobacterium agaricidamnosum NBRC 102515 = DSM 9628]